MKKYDQNITATINKSSMAWLLALLFFICFSVTINPEASIAQKTPDKKAAVKNESAEQGSEEAQETQPQFQKLSGIRLGALPEYTRVIFEFALPVTEYTVRRDDVDNLVLEFGDAQSEKTGRLNLGDDLVEGIAIVRTKNNLAATIKLKPVRFSFRHFSTPDQKSVVVDIKKPAVSSTIDEPASLPAGDRKLEMPSLQQITQKIRARLPKEPKPETAAGLLSLASDAIIAGAYGSAVENLEKLKAGFPTSHINDPAIFLLGESYYNMDPENFSSVFLKTTSTMQEGLTSFPRSTLAPRASMLKALAYERMDYYNEAIAFLKLTVKDFPESEYAVLSTMHLANLYLKLDKPNLAKATIESILAQGYSGDILLQSYAKLGEKYFQEGLFSKANEVFKAIIKRDDKFYLENPEILYYMGEGYYHLNRMDLARAFLYHAVNLQPDNESSNIMLARIGDTYKEEKLDDEAIRIFAMTYNNYPDTDGGMISLMRLADYGALTRLFKPGAIFPELENGSKMATLAIYEKVLKAKEDSPLNQLTQFKIGKLYMEQEYYSKALEAFADILNKDIQEPFKKEVREVFNQALLNEFKNLDILKKHVELIALYAESNNFVNDDVWPDLRHYLARAYAALSMPSEAAKLWEANKGLAEDQEDQRLLGLSKVYMSMGRYADVIKALEQFRKDFPKHPEANKTLIDQARAEVKLNKDNEALGHLEAGVKKSPEFLNDYNVQNMLSELYLKKGDYPKGIPAINQAIASIKGQKERKEDLFLQYSRLGRAYHHVGKTKEALAALDAAMALMPKNPMPETLYLMADAFKRMGQKEKQKQILDLMVKNRNPFWRDVANQEIVELEPDKRISRLIDQRSSKNVESRNGSKNDSSPDQPGREPSPTAP